MTYQPGDILFFSAFNGNIEDTLIEQWTASTFVHVAIAVSDTQVIEATNTGVQLDERGTRPVATVWSYAEHVPHSMGLQDALLWLHSQIGQMYGWGDIVNAALEKVESVITLDIGEHFDCSGLACEFLLKAGGVKELATITDAHRITPAMLAALLKVPPLS